MKVLMIRFSSIGDIVLTTPAIRAFKEKYPNAKIDYLVFDKFSDAISLNPDIDNLITFNKKSDGTLFNLIKFSKKLKENNYDYVFDMHSKIRTKIISKIIGAKTYSYVKRPFLQYILVKLRFLKYSVVKTIVKRYFDIFKDFDITYIGEDLHFYFSKKDEEKVKEYANFPVMAPASSKEIKDWSEENYGKLIKMIYDKYQIKTILIGSKADVKKCENINRISENNAIILAGKLSLNESGALLSKAKFLVGSDSGPFHIARGVKCPTFVLFAPTNPFLFEFDSNTHLIYPGVSSSENHEYGDSKCNKKYLTNMNNINCMDVFYQIEKSNLL